MHAMTSPLDIYDLRILLEIAAALSDSLNLKAANIRMMVNA